MMLYYAKFTKEKGKRYLVEFPDLKGCLTEGTALERAQGECEEALDGWLAARCDRTLLIPTSRRRQGRDYFPVAVDVQIEFAIRLRQLRLKRGLSQSAVADKLGISQQAYAKLESPVKANPSLTTLQKLSEVLDAELEVKLVA